MIPNKKIRPNNDDDEDFSWEEEAHENRSEFIKIIANGFDDKELFALKDVEKEYTMALVPYDQERDSNGYNEYLVHVWVRARVTAYDDVHAQRLAEDGHEFWNEYQIVDTEPGDDDEWEDDPLNKGE